MTAPPAVLAPARRAAPPPRARTVPLAQRHRAFSGRAVFRAGGDRFRSEGEHASPQDPWRNRHRDRADRSRAARPGGGDGSAGAAGRHHRRGRQRRAEQRHAQRRRDPERGGHDLLLRVRDHAQLHRQRPGPARERGQRQPPRGRRRRRRRPRAGHDLPLPARRPQQAGRAAGRGPDVPHQAPAARALARRHAEPGRAGRAHDDRGRAVGHGQRRAADRAAEQPVPVHAGLPERVQRPAHQPGRDLLVPGPVGVDQHAVPRVAAQPAAGRRARS